MKKQCACWDSGAQGFIFLSPMKTKALLKQIYKPECLHNTYLRTFREMCHFPVTLYRLIIQSHPTLGMMHQGTDQPLFLCRCPGVLLCPAPQLQHLWWLLCSHSHISLVHIILCTQYYICWSRYVALGIFIKHDVYLNLYVFSFITSVIKSKLQSAWASKPNALAWSSRKQCFLENAFSFLQKSRKAEKMQST